MKYLLFSVLLVTAALLGLNQTTFAACGGGPTVFTCDTNPPNPDPDGIQQSGNDLNLTINVLPGAAIDTGLQPGLDLDGIVTGDGNNIVSVEDASVTGQDRGIDTDDGADQITIIKSEIKGITDQALFSDDGNDTITIIDSVLMTVENDTTVQTSEGNNIISISGSFLSSPGGTTVNTGNDNDTIHVSDSELLVTIAAGGDQAISSGNGDDTVTVERSILQGGTTNPTEPIAISLGNNDDTLTLGTSADLKGLNMDNEQVIGIIDCGDGFDTIIFAMDVPPELLNGLSGQLAIADPAGDTIVINRLTYTWEDCELLVNELNPVRMTRPIPTLSEWGLIAMAGVLGIIGLISVRRRAIAH